MTSFALLEQVDSIVPSRPDSTDSIKEKIDTVSESFRIGKTRDVEFRKSQLRNLYFCIKDNLKQLQDAIRLDFHRPPIETEMLEIGMVLSEIGMAIDNLDSWVKRSQLGFSDLRIAAAFPCVEKMPYGTVLVIGPWNFPYLCTVVPLASALAAGNTVVLKPSELAPKASEVLTRILVRALDPSVFQVVSGGAPESSFLLAHKWGKIMFTGSTTVGKIVAEAAAKTLSPITLELGGKSPVIISRKANIHLSAKRLAWAKFTNAGQACISPDYVIIDRDIQAAFIESFQRAIEQAYPDLNMDTVDYAHIVNDAHWDRLASLVKNTRGNIVFSAARPDRPSRFYPPTLIADVPLDDVTMQNELFGPILPFVPVDNVAEDAPEIVRYSDNPLALYIFTRDSKEANHLLANINSGSAMVNDCLLQGGASIVPFGGIGESGTGRYHGKFGFDEFTHERPVLRQPEFVEFMLDPRYPPYNRNNMRRLAILNFRFEWYPRHGPVVKSLLARLVSTPWLIVIVLSAIYMKFKPF